jgi:hypothetical protein
VTAIVKLSAMRWDETDPESDVLVTLRTAFARMRSFSWMRL